MLGNCTYSLHVKAPSGWHVGDIWASFINISLCVLENLHANSSLRCWRMPCCIPLNHANNTSTESEQMLLRLSCVLSPCVCFLCSSPLFCASSCSCNCLFLFPTHLLLPPTLLILSTLLFECAPAHLLFLQ